MTFQTLNLDNQLETALASGHPWIYRNHLPKHRLQNGEWVRLSAGSAEAYGLYDSNSPVAVRLFGSLPPTPGFIAARVHEALELRAGLFNAPQLNASQTQATKGGEDRSVPPTGAQHTTAYRLIYGEGDFIPGVSVDLYERFAVLQTYASSIAVIVPEVVRALTKHLKLRGVVTKEEGTLRALWGKLPPPELSVQENGIKLLANLFEGQKGGLFLDHRDNRQLLSRFTADKTVLNVFSYTGAFSLYAVRGGSLKVTSVDIAQPATDDARRNFALNGFSPEAHAFITADGFKFLEEYAASDRRFGVVVLDPPSLAKRKKSRHAALRAYEKLNTLALRCTQPGGILATASCTSQVSPEAFRKALGEAAAKAGVRLQVLHEAGHAPDHPVPANFPEGRYLKFIIARVLGQ